MQFRYHKENYPKLTPELKLKYPTIICDDGFYRYSVFGIWLMPKSFKKFIGIQKFTYDGMKSLFFGFKFFVIKIGFQSEDEVYDPCSCKYCKPIQQSINKSIEIQKLLKK